jgi:hypothetical protein
MFPDSFVHLGGDEVCCEYALEFLFLFLSEGLVYYQKCVCDVCSCHQVDTRCWNETAVRTWLQENKMTEQDAYIMFVDRAHAMAASHGRATIAWQEVRHHAFTYC